MQDNNTNQITELRYDIEDLCRSVDAISSHLGIHNSYDTIVTATLVEQQHDELQNRDFIIGDRVTITNDYKKRKGTSGIVLRITPHCVRIGTRFGELFYKSKSSVRIDN